MAAKLQRSDWAIILVQVGVAMVVLFLWSHVFTHSVCLSRDRGVEAVYEKIQERKFQPGFKMEELTTSEVVLYVGYCLDHVLQEGKKPQFALVVPLIGIYATFVVAAFFHFRRRN